ncbi:hypothetical protein BVX98_07765 [bacterium F11]|nr:hypothetical protein BVX98_07765 [bacterium F11]
MKKFHFPFSYLIIILFLSGLVTPVSADNTGDWYDNNDEYHSYINISVHPGLQGMASHKRTINYSIFPDKVIVGNASVAHMGEYWGSMTRVYLMTSHGANKSYQQYINNHCYWYPEHRDYDDKEHFHTRIPTNGISQGSSGSERDELNKWFYTLAAFQPEVKERLKETGLLMPTMQMLARRTRVNSDAEYLTGKPHPGAFDDFGNTDAMVAMASAMSLSALPPMVQIEVLEENYDGENKADFFELSATEQHLQTPVTIARIFRGRHYTKRMVVSAANSYDLDPNQTLEYKWALLQGDPNLVQIHERNSGEEAEILIDYHPETTIAGTSKLTNLVVIGVFVKNSEYYSAPAFVTSFSLHNEVRHYDSNTKKLMKIDYNTNYVHPYLSRNKSWSSDDFVYDSEGELKGWLRQKSGEPDKFTKEGFLIVDGDLNGTILMAQRVNYVLNDSKKLVYNPSGNPFPYTGDFDSPQITITHPTQGPAVSGTISFSADATDNKEVSKVDFYVGREENPIGTDTTAPYSIDWDTTLQPDGYTSIRAVATDPSGNTGEDFGYIYIQNGPDETPPQVFFEMPYKDATVSGLTDVFVMAYDQSYGLEPNDMEGNQGIVSIDVFLDENSHPMATSETSPLEFKWNTNTIPNGTHTLTAKATDEAGNIGEQTITVTVTNGTPYILTVTNGTGGGPYAEGDEVAVEANPPPEGQEFDRWTGETNGIDNIFVAHTTVTMPAAHVEITATYKTVRGEPTSPLPTEKFINYFYPERNEIVEIPCEKRVTIINRDGLELNHLSCKGATRHNGTLGKARWNGKNTNGKTYAAGTYTAIEKSRTHKVVILK